MESKFRYCEIHFEYFVEAYVPAIDFAYISYRRDLKYLKARERFPNTRHIVQGPKGTLVSVWYCRSCEEAADQWFAGQGYTDGPTEEEKHAAAERELAELEKKLGLIPDAQNNQP